MGWMLAQWDWMQFHENKNCSHCHFLHKWSRNERSVNHTFGTDQHVREVAACIHRCEISVWDRTATLQRVSTVLEEMTEERRRRASGISSSSSPPLHESRFASCFCSCRCCRSCPLSCREQSKQSKQAATSASVQGLQPVLQSLYCKRTSSGVRWSNIRVCFPLLLLLPWQRCVGVSNGKRHHLSRREKWMGWRGCLAFLPSCRCGRKPKGEGDGTKTASVTQFDDERWMWDRQTEKGGGRERKRDHYIGDHNFSFSLHALLIFQEGKVMPRKLARFLSSKGWGLGIELQNYINDTGWTELVVRNFYLYSFSTEFLCKLRQICPYDQQSSADAINDKNSEFCVCVSRRRVE